MTGDQNETEPSQVDRREAAADGRPVPADNFVATLAANVDNGGLSDSQFRAFVRDTLPIVQYPRRAEDMRDATDMSPLEWDVLRISDGQIVDLPYDDAQRRATERLEDLGLLRRGMEDDQPTAAATSLGRLLLAERDKAKDHPDEAAG